MRLFRKTSSAPLEATPPAKKGRWRVRMAKRLVMWLTPFALDVIRRRRKRGGETEGPGGRFNRK
jgi:hypothetical protein